MGQVLGCQARNRGVAVAAKPEAGVDVKMLAPVTGGADMFSVGAKFKWYFIYFLSDHFAVAQSTGENCLRR